VTDSKAYIGRGVSKILALKASQAVTNALD